MLTIRREQMQTLEATMGRRFADRMVHRVRTGFADRFRELTSVDASAADGDALVREWIDVAASFGIEKENNIEIFIDWMLEYGPDFHLQDERAWVKDILEFDAWSEDGKIGAIEDGLDDEG